MAVTGWGTSEDRRRSRKGGFDHHLAKPVNFDDLQSLLQQIVTAQGTLARGEVHDLDMR